MDRVALYLQDKHPIRDGMHYAQLAEQAGFEAVWQAESRLVREATVPMAAYAAVTERIAHRQRRRQHLDAQRRPARRDVLDARRPRPGPGQARDRRVVGPARGEGRHPPHASRSQCMRETVEATRRLLAMERVTYHGEFVHLDDVEIDIVHGDRSPKHVPIYIGATAMKMMELAGEIGDGVLLNYLVGPAYNAEAMEHLAVGAERGRAHRRRRRPAAARRLLARRRPLGRARPRAGARRAVPRPAAAHHEGERRRRVAARGDRRACSPGRRRRSRSRGRWSSCRTTSCS